MSFDHREAPTEPPTPAVSGNPAKRWWRWGIVLAGIILGQFILYGPSLLGQKILLPLDILQQPQVWTPTRPDAPQIELQDDVLTDLIYFMEPARRFAHAELSAGRFPMWTPYQFAGAPFVFPKYSPFKLLEFCSVSPVILAWSQMLAALVTGLGAYLYFRRALKLNFWAAAVPAWCYPLTAFFVFWAGYTTCGAVYWLPWTLLAVDSLVRRPGWLATLGVTTTTCLVLVSGHIDVAGQVLLIAGIHALWSIWDLHRRAWWQGPARRTAFALAAAWLLGFLLAAPHILPLLEYAKTGARMARRSSGAEERPPLGLAALPETVLPDVYGSRAHGSIPIFPPRQGNLQESAGAAYVGLLATLALAPLAWCNPRRRSATWFWAGIAVLGLSWCLDLPGLVDVFRLPVLNMMSHNRLTFASAFALLGLAAIGLEAVQTGKVTWRWWFWPPLITVLGIAAWNIWRAQQLPEFIATELPKAVQAGRTVRWAHDVAGVAQAQHWFVTHYWRAAAWAMVAAAAWLFRWWRRPGRVAITALLLPAELLLFAAGRNPQQDPARYFPRLPVLEQIAQAAPGRIATYACLPASLLQIQQLRDVRGYDSVDPGRLMDLMAATADPDFPTYEYAQTQWYVPPLGETITNGIPLPPLLDMLGVRYLILRGTPPANVRPDFQSEDYWALVNSNALPRAYVPRRVETVAGSYERLANLKSPAFDARAVAYVESPVTLPPECRGTVAITAEIPTRVTLDVNMETPGLVVLADLWDPGWHAQLDGKPVPILRANHAIRGVVVPAGHGTLEFRYAPASVAWGLRLAGAAAVILLGWTTVAARRNRAPRINPI